LLHNGKHGWTAETSFEKIVDLPEGVRDALLPHTPSFTARLVDLSPEHATALEEAWLTAFGKLVLWALSIAGDDPRFLAEIDRMQGAIAEALAAPDGRAGPEQGPFRRQGRCGGRGRRRRGRRCGFGARGGRRRRW
jgi:hypothetical protein